MQSEFLTVATVLKPQGVRGEVKTIALTDSAADLAKLTKVLIDGVEYPVLSARIQGEFVYFCLKGVADRNAAELLRGKELEAYRCDIPPLPEGRYYIVDLIGCKVVTDRGICLGEVTSVTPAKTDIFVIDAGGKEVTFVAADGVIEEVDIPAKKIVVNAKRFKEVSL